MLTAIVLIEETLVGVFVTMILLVGWDVTIKEEAVLLMLASAGARCLL